MGEGKSLHNQEKSINSYMLACLLHDVAHSPFSHTFEDAYDENKIGLDTPLLKLLNSEEFTNDYKKYSNRTASHEKMSAFLAYKVFRDKFVNSGDVNIKEYADWELIVRMICGIYYSNHPQADIFNCLIDLIHGDVIDADGLDYVCRDAWAAGYQTSNVDVDRLIDAIEIIKDKDGIHKIAFTSKALNEIEAVLSVKNFQQYHVINHHTVTYEQHLLVEAVKAAARHYFNEKNEEESSLAKLCSLISFTDGIVTEKNDRTIIYPMDDDFISIMKSCISEPYVKEWFSRNYSLVPVWKSRADFYEIFDFLRGCLLTSKHWIFSEKCKNFLAEKLGLKKDEIWILKASPKYKGSFANKVYLHVHNELVKYVDLFPGDKNSFEPPKSEFFYLYVKRGTNIQEIVDLLKKEAALYVVQK